MTWVIGFDILRHVVEFIFYIITGPLLAIFTIKYLKRQRRVDRQLDEVLRRLDRLQRHGVVSLPQDIIPTLNEFHPTDPKNVLLSTTTSEVEDVYPKVTESDISNG